MLFALLSLYCTVLYWLTVMCGQRVGDVRCFIPSRALDDHLYSVIFSVSLVRQCFMSMSSACSLSTLIKTAYTCPE